MKWSAAEPPCSDPYPQSGANDAPQAQCRALIKSRASNLELRQDAFCPQPASEGPAPKLRRGSGCTGAQSVPFLRTPAWTLLAAEAAVELMSSGR